MRRGKAFRGLRPLLADVVAPIAAYYGLRSLGVGDLPALLAGFSVVAADALISLAIERRLRRLPILVCVMFALTAGLAFVTHDARVLLLKPAIISTALGIYLLLLAASRPKLFAALQPLIARGSAERSARWTRAWEEQPFVRDRMRLACALAGLLLLAEAAARTVIAFYLPLGESLFLVHVPAVILAVALILIVWLLVKPAAVRAMAECGGQEAW